jgi:hypothetical protein
VAEFQKRGALHWHLAFQGRRRGETWALIIRKVESLWKNSLEKIGVYPTSMAAACNMQRVKKTLAGYLSKYLSKGDKALATIENEEEAPPKPASWWGCTKTLRERVQKARIRVVGIASPEFTWEQGLTTLRQVRGVLWADIIRLQDGFIAALCGRSKPPELKRAMYQYLLL